MLWLGIRDPIVPAILLASSATAVTLSTWRRKHRLYSYVTYIEIGLQFIAVACLGRLFGPLVVMPAFLTVSACAMAMVERRAVRNYGLVCSLVTLLGSFVLEHLAILPSSYRFTDGSIEILPTAFGFPAQATPMVLLVAAMVTIILPWAAMSRIRQRITALQNEAALHSWHLSQLLPEETTESRVPATAP